MAAADPVGSGGRPGRESRRPGGLPGSIERILAWVEAFSATLFTLAILVEAVNMVMRWFGTGIPEGIEAASLVMVVMTFLGISRAFVTGEHVRFSALERRFAPGWSRSIQLLAIALTLLTLAIVAYLGAVATLQFAKLGMTATTMPWLPLWIPASSIPIGSGLGVLALVLFGARLLHRRALAE